MHQVKWLCLAVFSSALAALSSQALADTSTFNYFYGAGASSYNVPEGGSLTVNLYLQEVNSDPSNPSLLASEDGLSAAGVNVSLLSGSNLNTIAAAAPNAGTPATGFDDPSSAGVVNSPLSATITESTVLGDLVGVDGSVPVDGVSNVLLGSVTIDGSLAPGVSTVFNVGVADPTLGNTFTNDSGYDLDNNADPFNPAGSETLYNSAAATSFSVTTVVPEPTALSLLAAAGLLLTRRLRLFARNVQPR